MRQLRTFAVVLQMTKCHDCGVEEGQYHLPGCDMEICPTCLHQLITCDCPDSNEKIIWIQIPNLCRLCGARWPDVFMVPDDEWKRTVPKNLQEETLCRPCYERVKELMLAKKNL